MSIWQVFGDIQDFTSMAVIKRITNYQQGQAIVVESELESPFDHRGGNILGIRITGDYQP